jgi:hypothetical protein
MDSSEHREEAVSPPRREDVESIDGIVKALYESFSGPAGPRDWKRMRSLFTPGGRMMPAWPRENGGATIECFDLEGYIASRSPYLAANPLYEIETDRREDRFGNIAQVWSAYDGYHTLEEKPFFRGANSIQLFHDGDRWWVVSLLCYNEIEAERPRRPLPGGC